MTKFHTISPAAASELLYSQRVNGRGTIFGLAFRRRSDRRDGSARAGDQEVVFCRFNVRKHLKGGKGWESPDGIITGHWRPGCKPASAAYDRFQHGLVCVFIMSRKTPGEARVYRSIPLDQLTWVKLDGVIYKIGAPAPVQH